MNRLYVTDLDGTLLDREGRLSKLSRAILKALIEEGALLTIATGRSLASLKEIMGDCLPNLPVIVHNGARIADPYTGEYSYSNVMNKGVLDEILAMALSHHLAPFLNAFEGPRDLFCYTLPANSATETYIRYRSTIMPDAMRPYRLRTELSSLEVINLNIVDDRRVLEDFKARVLEACSPWVDVHITTDPQYADIGWLTVGDCRSHKAEAIRILAASVSGSPLHVTVFGDQDNDLHMFEAADRAIAVGNAAPELLERAGEVIGPHWEDSVAKFIAREWMEAHGQEAVFEGL